MSDLVEKKIYVIVRYYDKGRSHTYLYNDYNSFIDAMHDFIFKYPKNKFKWFSRWCWYRKSDFYD